MACAYVQAVETGDCACHHTSTYTVGTQVLCLANWLRYARKTGVKRKERAAQNHLASTRAPTPINPPGQYDPSTRAFPICKQDFVPPPLRNPPSEGPKFVFVCFHDTVPVPAQTLAQLAQSGARCGHLLIWPAQEYDRLPEPFGPSSSCRLLPLSRFALPGAIRSTC